MPFLYRVELASLSFSADCIWEFGSSGCDFNPPLCSRMAEWTLGYPHATSASGGCSCVSCSLLVPVGHSRWRAKISPVPAAYFYPVICLLHFQRHLLTLHVPLPPTIHQDVLCRTGSLCTLSLCGRFGPGCRETRVCWDGQRHRAPLSQRKLPSSKLLLVLVCDAGDFGPLFLRSDIRSGHSDCGRGNSKDWAGNSESRGRDTPFTKWRFPGFWGTSWMWKTGTCCGLLDFTQYIHASVVGNIQCFDQRCAAVRAEFLLSALWHQDLSPLCRLGQHSKPSGLLCGHVFPT